MKLFFLFAADIDAARWSLFAYEEPSELHKGFYYLAMLLSQLWYLLIWLPLCWVLLKKTLERFALQLGFITCACAKFDLCFVGFFGASRFHFPFLPFLVVLSAGVLISKLAED